MNINELIAAKDYKNVLQNFSNLSVIPRGSDYNQKISDWLCCFAKENHLEYVQDEALNVIIKKPASSGYEKAPAVILQGHMDMVCVKLPEIQHDFEKEGLELLTDGTFIYANGTTLGGDDGISIAYMMSVLTDCELLHPELICIITTNEETGMEGAKILEAEKYPAAYLINIDSEEDGTCWCGCAGGQRVDAELPLRRINKKGISIKIILSGLTGGHSGSEIDKYIPNAVTVMGRLLYEFGNECNFSLVSLNGGEKDNSIPANSEAEILLTDYEYKKDFLVLEQLAEKLRKNYCASQKKMSFSILCNSITEKSCMSQESRNQLLFLLLLAPDGVQRMSTEVPNLVETSLNLGIFKSNENKADFHYSLRSSVSSELAFLTAKLRLLIEHSGGSSITGASYPAWEYREKSNLRELFHVSYKQVYGTEPVDKVIHAGLECGLFSEKMPETDMISIGPDMFDIHTPKERLNSVSAIRLYQVLELLLNQLCRLE